MQFRSFAEPQSFYDAALPYLAQHEAHNCVILGIVGNLICQGANGLPDAPHYSLVGEQGRALAAALLTPGRALLIAKSDNKDAIRLLAKELHAEFPALPGVNGFVPTAEAFANAWTDFSGQAYTLRMRQGLYQLEAVIPVENVSGSMIRATTAHRDILIQWMSGFMVEALAASDTSTVGNLIDRRIADDDNALYLWCDPDPVALAGVSGPTPNGIRINAVYTPPKNRRRGYASALTATLSQMMLDRGRKYCFLFTDLSNPTSNHIYQSVGYTYVCDVNVYNFLADAD